MKFAACGLFSTIQSTIREHFVGVCETGAFSVSASLRYLVPVHSCSNAAKSPTKPNASHSWTSWSNSLVAVAIVFDVEYATTQTLAPESQAGSQGKFLLWPEPLEYI